MPAVLESYANNDSNLQDVINQYVTEFQQQSHTGTPTVGHAPPEHYQKQRDQLLKENEQLKAELAQAQECIKHFKANQQSTDLNDANELTPEQEILHTRKRNNVLKIIAVLADMASLPCEPFTAFNMIEAHATSKQMEIPSQNVVAEWIQKSRQ